MAASKSTGEDRRDVQNVKLVDASLNDLTAGNPLAVTNSATTGNVDIIIQASGVQASTYTSTIQTNLGCRGGYVIVNASANSNTTNGLKISVAGVDPATGTAIYTIYAETTGHTAASGVFVLPIYPSDVPVAGDNAISLGLPLKFKVIVTHADAASATYSVSVSLII